MADPSVAGPEAAGDVAAVAIGRNEGERLVRCLASLSGRARRVIYVDSGSEDGSVAAAEAAGAEVVTLDRDVPFTAARARNAGAARLKGDPGLRYIQFIDGDCALDPEWIATARTFLESRADAAVACGRRREVAPEASVYNRLCDMEWNTPIGQAAACGGDSLMRLDAFRAAGGFDPSLIAGEEPDLCFRLRGLGWTVWRLDAEMTRHDAAMTRFGQWWRRAIRGGWAYAEGAWRHGRSPERYNLRPLARLLIWGGGYPAALLLLGLAGAGWLAAAGLAVYPVQALRVARARRRAFGDPWPEALAFGAFVMLGKVPEMIGALRFAWRLIRGGSATLIEYKGAAAEKRT